MALGTFYLQGALGLPRDYNLAFKYFEAASLHGDPAGKANLGFMYANGLGTEQDNETAITLYKQAAEMVVYYSLDVIDILVESSCPYKLGIDVFRRRSSRKGFR